MKFFSEIGSPPSHSIAVGAWQAGQLKGRKPDTKARSGWSQLQLPVTGVRGPGEERKQRRLRPHWHFLASAGGLTAPSVLSLEASFDLWRLGEEFDSHGTLHPPLPRQVDNLFTRPPPCKYGLLEAGTVFPTRNSSCPVHHCCWSELENKCMNSFPHPCAKWWEILNPGRFQGILVRQNSHALWR